MRKSLLASAIIAAGVSFFGLSQAAFAAGASAAMEGPNGEALGTVTLTQTAQGVLIHAELTGLTAGPHGFHVHETGACSPDFKAAGGHFNPHGGSHGYSHDGAPHAGDMPNIFAHADGSATADTLNALISLEEGGAGSVFDGDGSAIVIHAKADSYGEDAGAGARDACGVIVAN